MASWDPQELSLQQCWLEVEAYESVWEEAGEYGSVWEEAEERRQTLVMTALQAGSWC